MRGGARRSGGLAFVNGKAGGCRSANKVSGHLRDFEAGRKEDMDADVLARTRHGTPIKRSFAYKRDDGVVGAGTQ